MSVQLHQKISITSLKIKILIFLQILVRVGEIERAQYGGSKIISFIESPSSDQHNFMAISSFFGENFSYR